MADQDFRGTGWAFPVAVDGNGRLQLASDAGAIRRSIELILSTAKGERVMRPDFGSELHAYLFKPLSLPNRRGIATTVKAALMKWERRIRVLNVEVTPSPGDAATALISIEYEIRSSSARGNLVYPFYAQGAGT